MSIIVNRHINLIDSNQFYKGSLDSDVSNLEDSDFKYLLSDFPVDKLEILKRKDAYPNLNIHLYLRKNTFIHH